MARAFKCIRVSLIGLSLLLPCVNHNHGFGAFGKPGLAADVLGGVITEDLSRRAGSAETKAANQSDWQVKKIQNGMAAVVVGQAQTPDGPAKATLSFYCVPGKGGTTGLEFIVMGAANMNGFPFNSFEGPDAPAAPLPLIVITAHRASGDLVVKTGCSGFYGGADVPDDAFTFEIASVTRARQRGISQISEALIQGATSLSIKVIGYKQPKKSVDITVQAAGAATAIGEVMKACHGQPPA